MALKLMISKTIQNTLLLVLFVILIISCKEESHVEIKLKAENSSLDTVYLKRIMTDELLFKFQVKDTTVDLNISEPILALVTSPGVKNDKFTFLIPGNESVISFRDSTFKTTNSRDTLLQYTFDQHGKMLGMYSNLFFSDGNDAKILEVYDSLIFANENVINEAGSRISKAAKEVISYQNEARAYNFLFYYGRMIKKLPYNDPFFNFIYNIGLEPQDLKTFPHPVLYKLEIQYLTKYDSINSVVDFIEFIEKKIQNEDNEQFLKAFFIKELIESPQYWEKHNRIFTSNELKIILENESQNKYSHLFTQSSQSYFSAMSGKNAQFFKALKTDSTLFDLAELEGDFVVIDAWATWCGPCIDQKPYFNDVVNHFKGNDNISFLSVSTDQSFDRWKSYVAKKESPALEVNVSGELNEPFSKSYNVQSIPRYIFISPEGKIIDADMEDPGKGMINRIESEMSNN